MQRWVYGARAGYFGGQAWWNELSKNTGGLTIAVDDFKVNPVEGEQANATFDYRFGVPQGTDAEAKAAIEKPQNETVALHFGADAERGGERVWQIVPPATEEEANKSVQKGGFFAYASYFLAQKGPMPLGFSGSKAAQRQNHLKQLALGVMMFLQDYDERYAFAPEYLHDAILPYVKSEEVFLVPGTQDTYSFNANLSDQSSNTLKEPAQTVLLYEGENLTFRYNGKAAIGFADGHVKLVSPDEAKELIWKP